jgi:uncharacterized membrane protein YbhN (UPF0104 family)
MMTDSTKTSTAKGRRSRWWVVQVVASVIVLWVFIRAIEPGQLQALPGRVRWDLLLVALVVKSIALLLHEVRVWLALPRPRPSLLLVARIGLVSGVINLVLPARAGDLALIAMLQRRCRVGVGAATAAMGVVAFLEAAVFGLLLMLGLVIGASQWQALLGVDAHAQALQLVGLATGAGLIGAAAVAIVGRRLAATPDPLPRPGLRHVLREATTQTGAALASPAAATLNVATAAAQVVLMVAAFAIALPAVGISVPAPFLAAAGVLGLSAISSIVLPPGYGAGPAAASLAVLSTMGASEVDALAYAGAWWVLSQVPAVGLGLPSMWSLGISLREPAT